MKITKKKQSIRETAGDYMFICTAVIFVIYPSIDIGKWSYVPHFMLGLGFVYVISKDKSSLRFSWPLFTFALYMAYIGLIYYVHGTSEGISLIETLISQNRLFFPFLALTIGVYSGDKNRDKVFLLVLVILLLIQTVVSFLQNFHEGFRLWIFPLYRQTLLEKYLEMFSRNSGGRVIGTIGNPNHLGIMMVIIETAIFFILGDVKNKRLKYICQITTLSMMVSTILMTQSRTAMMALSVAAFLAMLFLIICSQAKYKKIYIALIITAVALGFIAITELMPRGFDLFTFGERVKIWQKQWDKLPSFSDGVVQHLFGIGYQNSRDLGTFDNQYLKIYVTGGIVGVLLLLIATMCLTRRSLSSRCNRSWMRIGFISIMVCALTSTVTEYHENMKMASMTFYVIGYSLAAVERKKRTMDII